MCELLNIQVAGAHHRALYCQTFYTGQPHWISGKKPVTLEKRYTLKHRHGPLSCKQCTIRLTELFILAGTAWCVLKECMGGGLQVAAVDTPFRAVTPGQVREPYNLLHSYSGLCSMQCFMIMKNVWELHSLLTPVLH